MPIICFQSHGVTTEAELAALRPTYDRIYQRRMPFITVSDARFADHSASQRKMWGAWLTREMQLDADNNARGSVVILDSALLRGALVALNWIAPPKIPQDVAGSFGEAVTQARAMAERFRLHVPETTWERVLGWLSQGDLSKRR